MSPYDLSCWWNIKHKRNNNNATVAFMSHHAMVDPISLLAMVIVTNWFLNKLFVSSQFVLRRNNPS